VKRHCAFLVIVMFFTSVSVHADLLGKNYEENKDSEKVLFYVTGVADGIRTSSIIAELRGLPPIYCPPRDRVFTAEEYLDIFERKYYSLPEDIRQSGPLGPMVYAALQQEFPCEPK
jgi:hypothetical protein